MELTDKHPLTIRLEQSSKLIPPPDKQIEKPPTDKTPPCEPDTPLTLRGHTHFVWSVAFSPDGRRLASGSQDGTVKLWDVTSEKFIRDVTKEKYRFTGVAWSTDGKYLVGAGAANAIKVWNPDTGELIHHLKGHESGVRCIAISATANSWPRAVTTTP